MMQKGRIGYGSNTQQHIFQSILLQSSMRFFTLCRNPLNRWLVCRLVYGDYKVKMNSAWMFGFKLNHADFCFSDYLGGANEFIVLHTIRHNKKLH